VYHREAFLQQWYGNEVLEPWSYGEEFTVFLIVPIFLKNNTTMNVHISPEWREHQTSSVGWHYFKFKNFVATIGYAV